MQYEHLGETLAFSRAIDRGHTLRLSGEAIVQERTGIHARVAIAMNDVVLSWSRLNIERDEDRVRLGNSAYKQMNGLGQVYPGDYLKHDLDTFCAGLWGEYVSGYLPEDMAGEANPSPPTFLLHPYVVKGGGTILFAPPGRGKSYTSMLMAVSIDAGIHTSFWRVVQAPVLFINLERSRQSVSNRLGAVNRVLGLPATRPLLTLNARGKSLADVLPACQRIVRERKIGCVFLDSISRAGAGDLTENQPVNRILDMLNGLADSWVGLGHTPRADETHVFGGVHFDAGADVCVQLLSQQLDDGTLGLGLQITKQNDVGKTGLGVMALEFNEAGLTAVRRAKRGEFPEVESGRKMSILQEVKGYLLENGACSATHLVKTLGRSRAGITDCLSDGEAFVKLGRDGHEVLYGVR